MRSTALSNVEHVTISNIFPILQVRRFVRFLTFTRGSDSPFWFRRAARESFSNALVPVAISALKHLLPLTATTLDSLPRRMHPASTTSRMGQPPSSQGFRDCLLPPAPQFWRVFGSGEYIHSGHPIKTRPAGILARSPASSARHCPTGRARKTVSRLPQLKPGSKRRRQERQIGGVGLRDPH
jgi:hypothetical protein